MIDLPGERLTEEQRRPLVDDDGRALLRSLLEHAHAPRFNHTCGDRLTAAGLDAVRAFDAEVRNGSTDGTEQPAWLDAFAADCTRRVPAYRRHGPLPRRFDEVPTVDRSALVAQPWSFVPDDHPLDEMVVFTTTGTTGGRLAYIASTPATAASYAVLLRAALATRGLTLDGGPGRTAVATVCWQKRTYTYASPSTFLDQGAILKLNLNPDEWNDPGDVARFLASVDPEVLTGDPVAFARLADLDVDLHPKALVSTAMALTDGLCDRLEARFGCPAIDVYGMNEAGPIAAAVGDGSGHIVLQPRLHVEVLGPDGHPVGPGQRGEVTLTGGFNPAFPLLRYRTGDHASLGRHPDGRQLLVGLEGRAPVRLVNVEGRALTTIDVTVALHPFALARSRLHQAADHSLVLGIEGSGIDESRLRAALADLFGAVPLTIEPMAGEPYQVPYTSDL